MCKEKVTTTRNMSKVFNRNKVNFLKNPIFFGEELNTQRYDDFKYPIFDKLTQRQLGYFLETRRSFSSKR